MKNLLKLIIIVGVFILMVLSCDEDKQYEKNDDSYYIIGFDNCTVRHEYRVGYYFVSSINDNVLLSYNEANTSSDKTVFFKNYLFSYFEYLCKTDFYTNRNLNNTSFVVLTKLLSFIDFLRNV